MTTLQFLDVSFNKLHALPHELGSLCELEALNLSFNPVGKLSGGLLPPPVLKMISLKELNLDYTGCREMDLQLGQLTSLKALKVLLLAHISAESTCRHIACTTIIGSSSAL